MRLGRRDRACRGIARCLAPGADAMLLCRRRRHAVARVRAQLRSAWGLLTPRACTHGVWVFEVTSPSSDAVERRPVVAPATFATLCCMYLARRISK